MVLSSNALIVAQMAIEKKNVLVLGSSPNLVLPSDYDENWCLISVNASGKIAKEKGLGRANLAVMAASVLLKTKPEFNEVRDNLSDLESDVTLVRFLSGGRIKRGVRTYKARKMLNAVGYRTNSVLGLAPNSWDFVLKKIMGDEYQIAKNISTGTFCVLLAIYAGAKRVVTAGIDPDSTGHAYSATNFKREHKNADRRVISFLIKNYSVDFGFCN